MSTRTATKIHDMTKANGAKVETMQPATEAMSVLTAEDVKVQLLAQVRAKLEQLLASPPQAETAEPLNWWDIYGFGPIQPGASPVPPAGFAGPLLPHQVIRKGELAFVATVILLNPIGPAVPTALDILSTFGLSYEVEYITGDLKRWEPAPAALQAVNTGVFVPGVSIYVDVFSFIAEHPGLYEMNISARIYGCNGNPAPPFSGFATWVYDPDQDYMGSLLGRGGPGFYHKDPIRFQVYE